MLRSDFMSSARAMTLFMVSITKWAREGLSVGG